MSEAYESYGDSTPPPPSLEAAAANFRAKIEEASNRLSGAAEQFVSMSDGLLAAVEQARQAAEQAAAAQRSVEDMRDEMARNYGNVSDLVHDLQQRIAALATLAQPMPSPEPPSEEPSYHEGTPGESSW